ncbi:MAG: PAS domain-containing sensor histidine kinase, partial [Chloroflexota bacterium]
LEITGDDESFRLLAETMPQKIFRARPNGDIDYFNRQWMEFTGLPFEQIKDWGWTQFIHPDDVAENVARWQHSIASLTPFQFEHRFRRADGVYRWHLSRAQPVFGADGRVLMWAGSNTDIDEQKRAETESQSARRQAERLMAQQTAMLSQMTDGIVVTDHSGKIIYMNETAGRVYGVMPIGVGVSGYAAAFNAFNLDGTPYRSEDSPAARASLHGETVLNARVMVRRPDGQERIIERSATPMRAEDGGSLGAVMNLKDVTEQIETERQKDEFLSAVAHDLKTPLTTIKGQSQLLLRRLAREKTVEPAQMFDGLSQIDSTVGRMARFIDELLDATHGEMDRPLELRVSKLNLVALVRSVVAAMRRNMDPHHIVVEASEDRVVGLWDSERLERVVANLLSNALKYSPEGATVRVTVSEEADTDGAWAVLKVQDQGFGIPAGDLKRVFERFYRCDNVANMVGGTGIGLSSVKQIVEHHGGKVVVESQEGEGSTFTVRLPLNRS